MRLIPVHPLVDKGKHHLLSHDEAVLGFYVGEHVGLVHNTTGHHGVALPEYVIQEHH